jgi:hypothetical protein
MVTDLTERQAIWQAWRSLQASSEWTQVVKPYLQAARDDVQLDLSSESCTPEQAYRLLGRLSVYQELLDLPQVMCTAADDQERIMAKREEQERLSDERRRERRPFAKWRAGLRRR